MEKIHQGLGVVSDYGHVPHAPNKPGLQLAAIYCRLSEEDRDKADPAADSRSIQNQKDMLAQYAAGQGWAVYAVYSDDDYTGSDRSRPAFNRLLEDARAGKFNIVLCKSQSRFTREMELVERYIHGYFPLWGIRFVGCADNADTANKGNKKARQINGLVNEWYLEDMSENIRTVLDAKRRQGQFIGSFCAYGYRKDPQDKHRLLPDAEAAAQVQEIFRLFLQGMGMGAIAKLLNERGVLNPSAYKKQHSPTFRRGRSTLTAGMWSSATVRYILTNPLYIGTLVQHVNEKVSYKSKAVRRVPPDQQMAVTGMHVPLVDAEQWHSVQKLLLVGGKAQHSIGRRDVLAAQCRCGLCGGRLSATYKTLKSGQRIKRLRCAAHAAGAALCPGTTVKREDVEEAVLQGVRTAVAQLADESYLAGHLRLQNARETARQALTKQLKTAKRQLLEQQGYLKSLYEDKVRGLVAEQQFLQLSAAFTTQQVQQEKQVESLAQQLEALEETEKNQMSATEIVKKYMNVETLTDEMVRQLVERVSIGCSEGYGKTPPIEISWRF